MWLQHRNGIFALLVLTAITAPLSQAQGGDPATLIQLKLGSQFKLTKTTADRTDIVTAGDVVLLHKDGLMMCSADSSYAYSNTYSNGVLAPNVKNRAKDAARSFLRGSLPFGGGASATDSANNACPSRKFVAGEKFWVTAITAQKDGILVSAYSDPYNDVHFYGEIKFPFAKGAVPSADDFSKTVQEVITVVPQDNAGDQGGQGGQPAQQAAPAAPAPAPLADIPPPPPPTDTPTISLGQTKDQVTAAFGKPLKTAKLGGKEIYTYKDMKVTFTNGKVTNVE